MDKKINKILIYTKSLNGHRESYLKFTTLLLNGKRTSIIEMLLKSNVVLFLMIEENFLLYVIISLWRSLFGWKTIGIMFRVKPLMFDNSVRLKLKRIILIVLRQIKKIVTLSIVPHYLFENVEKYATDWIYDFQFWDISNDEIIKYRELRNNKSINKNRIIDSTDIINKKLILSVGIQNPHKGIIKLMSIFNENIQLRNKYIFICAGIVQSIPSNIINDFKSNGGYVINKKLTDEEILTLYSNSDLIWNFYSENYDQSSGVFGRSIQFKIPSIVRENSLTHKICEKENIHAIVVNECNIVDKIMSYQFPLKNSSLDNFKDQFLIDEIKNSSLNKLLFYIN